MKYHRVIETDNDGLLCTEFDLHGIDPDILFQGVTIQNWNECVTLWHDGDGLGEDYVANRLCWPVCSARMRRVLEQVTASEIQYLPVRIGNRLTGKVTSEYYVANILRLVEAMDLQHATTMMTPSGLVIIKYAFLRTVITSHNIFRLAENSIVLAVSDRVKVALQYHGITGCDFREVPAY